MKDFASLDRLIAAFRDAGATRLLVKPLSPNDNSKNQIYFGGDFSSLTALPHGELVFSDSSRGRMAKAELPLSWLKPEGGCVKAPHSQLILYPQYPEIRFSGFLKGCKEAPNDLLTSRDEGRILFLGVSPSSGCFGYATGPGSQLANEFARLGTSPSLAVFHELAISNDEESNFRKLLAALRAIHEKNWITSWRFDGKGNRCACNASNCGGFTLEAELGIRPNSVAGPDLLGWEVKQHGFADWERPIASSAVTLLTPEPDGGYYAEKGVERFLRKFGYKDRREREDRINFGGTFIVGKTEKNTKLKLELTGYKPGTKGIDPSGSLRIVNDAGVVASSWSNEALIKHWARKHARAVYVPSECRKNGVRSYRYGSTVCIGRGTRADLLMNAITTGRMYIDPGIKLEGASSAHPKTKRRNQFRVKWGNLESLYEQWELKRLVD